MAYPCRSAGARCRPSASFYQPGRHSIGWLTRRPTRQAFLLDFHWSAPKGVTKALGYAGPIGESYLVSLDGDPLGRLVDQDGLSVSGVRVSGTHAQRAPAVRTP